ncbi:COG0665 Glycine D-amino acid oxidases (deaminating) [Vibrio sp. B1REV9]|uniref:NAD(P)/FAD-dependent oxidoreductase n=1 Tax=Vibrio sp. B1REV9 TaxID=2751179 RepID=UPI001AFE7870|nr:FAD-dependent oxidoreductase [Vibrio sp. B1REV9]CAE6944603.1 COG0665 Glycine D-amino acid oxidases (deaminating) [Vibrio sp. B1REV9]
MLGEAGTSNNNIAVVGAGVIGLAIGLKLQKQGHQVTIFDPNGVGSGCSKGNAGHIATEQVFPLSTPSLIPQLPKMLLSSESPVSIRWQDLPKTVGWMIRFLLNATPSASKASTRAIKTLNEQSVKSWFELLESIGQSALIKMDGSLLTFESKRLFEHYQSTLAELMNQGVNYEIWTQNQIRERLPEISKNVQVGVFFPDTGHTVDPYAICVELSRAFEKLGGRVELKEVDALRKNGGLLADAQRYRFDRVVVAAGVHSKALVKQLTGINVPIQAERGYHLMMDDKHESLPFPVSSADRKFIMTPMRDGLRLAGTVEYADVKSPPNMARAAMLYQQGNAMFQSGLNASKQKETWMGNRPSTSDSLPIIDRICDGKILLAFGHQHLGLTQAAITADLISELIAESLPSVNLAPFTLHRFA